MENKEEVTLLTVLCKLSIDQPQVKETDDEDHTLTASVFGNHLILKEIFKHLQVSDLLKCSLVDSFWKSNGRTVLRENKRCLVRIRRYRSCVDLINFVDMLPRFHKNEIPFNGMSIVTPPLFDNSRMRSGWNENDCIQCDDPSKFTESLLSLITIRHLKLGWLDTDCRDFRQSKCPTSLLIKKIVAGSSSTLEGLQFVFVYGMAPWPMSLMKYFLGTDTDLSGNNLTILFPKLEFLKTPLYPSSPRRFHKTEELLDMAPKIKHLMGEIEPKHAEYLLKFRKVDILKQFIFKPGQIEYVGGGSPCKDATDRKLYRDLQLSLQLATEQPKLKRLTVVTKWVVKRRNPDDCAKTLTQITEICRRLFESSFKSLHSLRISHLDLLVLQRSGGIVPTKVKQLTIYYMLYASNLHKATECISQNLESIQFSKIFPYLEGIKLYGYQQYKTYIKKSIVALERIAMKSEKMSLTGKGGEKSCTSVSKLKLKSWTLYDWYEDPWVAASRPRDYEKRLELLAHKVTKDEEIMKSMQDIYRTIFPNVTEFTYRHDLLRDLKGTCKYFWTTWNNLERIKIYGVRHEDALGNLDSDFLGVEEEQCCLLRQSDDCLSFFLQNQVGTSIRNLTKLKLLRIEILHNNRVQCCKESSSESGESAEKPNTDPDLVFLSAAAATCTIAQMPKLTLEFVRQTCKPTNSKCHLTCDHLKPFVKFLDPADIVWEKFDDEPVRPNA